MTSVLTIFAELHVRIVWQTRVEVRHERADVLRGGEPTVNVITGVEKSPGGNRDVGDRMPVEWKLKRKFHRHRSTVRLRQKFVDGKIGAICVNAFSMEVCKVLIWNDGAVVVFMKVLVDLRDVVRYERLVGLLIDDIDLRPFNRRTVLAAVWIVLWSIRCGNANLRCQRSRRLCGCYQWFDWWCDIRYFGSRCYNRLVYTSAVKWRYVFINCRLGWNWKIEREITSVRWNCN